MSHEPRKQAWCCQPHPKGGCLDKEQEKVLEIHSIFHPCSKKYIFPWIHTWPWYCQASSPVPCVGVPLGQPQASRMHQIPFSRGEMGPLPSSVLCTHLDPKAVRALVPGASARAPSSFWLGLANLFHQRPPAKQAPCTAKRNRLPCTATPAMAAQGRGQDRGHWYSSHQIPF